MTIYEKLLKQKCSSGRVPAWKERGPDFKSTETTTKTKETPAHSISCSGGLLGGFSSLG
jgi:hypothetical protein